MMPCGRQHGAGSDDLYQRHSWIRTLRWPSGCRVESRRLGPRFRALLLLLLRLRLWRRRRLLLLRTCFGSATIPFAPDSSLGAAVGSQLANLATAALADRSNWAVSLAFLVVPLCHVEAAKTFYYAVYVPGRGWGIATRWAIAVCLGAINHPGAVHHSCFGQPGCRFRPPRVSIEGGRRCPGIIPPFPARG